jgi:hypothetical protein
METSEISETLHEAAEEHGEAEHAHGQHRSRIGDETFRKRVGILIGVLAVILAITETAGNAAMKETINSNIQASDNFAFYQARNIRQTDTRLAADQLDSLIQSRPDLAESAATAIRAKADDYRKQADRWESDPKAGDGKKELLAKATAAQDRRNEAQTRDENFELAAALLQIAVVLASSSILHASRPLVWVSCIFAACGAFVSVNGFLGFMELPFWHG